MSYVLPGAPDTALRLSGSDPRLALQLPSSARITGNTEVLSRNVRIADDTETISLWLNAHVLSTADSAFNRLLSDLNRLL